jgi:hypothetical protein
MKEKRTVAMPPRESLRPVTNADVDEYVRTRATQGVRSARVGVRAPIVDSEIGWDDVPARRSRRRHPVAAADDWGLAESDAWVVEPQSAAERSSSTREEASRERSARAVRAELASDWEAEHRLSDDWEPWDSEHQSTGGWAPPKSSLSPDGVDDSAAAIAAQPEPVPVVFDGEISAARVDHAAADRSTPSPPATDDIWGVRPRTSEGRRTIVITGRGDERQLPRRRGWEGSLPLHERSGFKPDRVAMWAVLLGVMLLLVAAASSHAAMLATHLGH